MSERDEGVSGLLDSLTDSTPVDWGRVLGEVPRGESADFVRALKDIEDVANAHRKIREQEAERENLQLERWGSLEIEEKLGRGGYAEVFRATDPTLDRKVALKLFHPERLRQLSRERLLNEGRALARLRHENVVTVYGADERDGRIGIWMEYVDGSTLRDVVETHGRMSADEAVSIGRRLCAALAAVHAKGMVHGDVKAQNIMRQEGEEGGRIVLMDFSSMRSTDHSVTGEARDNVAGTPLYMAPEMFQGATADVSGDIYSLGVLLYYLVTGSFPVRANTLEELRAAHRNRERVLLRDARPELPDDFVYVVERALAFRPEERFHTAGEMRQALEATVARNQLETSGPVPGEDARGARPLVYLAGLLLGLTGLGFVSSMAYELFLQIPPELTDEGPLDYLLWGVRLMIPIAVLCFVFGGGLFVLGFLARSAISKLGRKGVPRGSPGRMRAWVERTDANTLALWMLAIAGVAFAVITWAFWDLFTTLNELRYASGETVDVSLLGSDARAFQQGRDSAYALLIVAVLFALFRWFPALERRGGEEINLRLTRWGLVAVVVASLVLCAIPYRLIWHNRSERVVFDGQRAYVLASDDSDVALYVPGADRRHRIVRAGDARLERTSERIRENIFDSP